MLAPLVLLACHSPAPPTANGLRRLAIEPLPLPVGAEGDVTRASPGGTLGGVPFPLSFSAIARTGDVLGGVEFGRLVSRTGAPLGLCEGLDATGLWRVGGGWTMLTHFECLPGALYRTRLRVSDDGTMTASATERLDGSGIDGGAYFCAGALTGWNTHLSAEEYEADARKHQPDGTVSDGFEGYNTLRSWWEDDFSHSHPWDYGWVVEIPEDGPPARRWSLGRFSHELALPMPDDQTVYLTDDSAQGGSLYLFQADVPRDLSAGTLYAARWSRRDDGAYDLAWLSLGHASDAEIESVARTQRAFDALYERSELSDGSCATPLQRADTSWGPECLRVRPGMETAASRLETRRAAALVGATTEIVKAEGMALAPELKTLFVALTRYEGPALAGEPANGARDDLALPANPCGGVWGLDLGTPAPGGPTGPWVASVARPWVEGQPEGSACRLDGIANPDNLAWLNGGGTLAIAEDTSRHPHAALWFFDVASRTLTRTMTAPPGAEITGLRWTPDVGGRGFLSVAIQHPWEGHPQVSEELRHSIAGVLGPFPPFAGR
jgi:secreted PhoX family phosphatase